MQLELIYHEKRVTLHKNKPIWWNGQWHTRCTKVGQETNFHQMKMSRKFFIISLICLECVLLCQKESSSSSTSTSIGTVMIGRMSLKQLLTAQIHMQSYTARHRDEGQNLFFVCTQQSISSPPIERFFLRFASLLPDTIGLAAHGVSFWKLLDLLKR